MATNGVNLRRLATEHFELGKRWWSASVWMQIGATVIGAIIMLVKVPTIWPAVASALVGIAASLCKWQADRTKSLGELILRAVEDEGFGWSLSGKQRADIQARASKWALKRAQQQDVAGAYYSSTTQPSPLRAVENVEESAWWSKHLAGTMHTLVSGIMVAAVIFLFAVMFTAWHSISSAQTSEAVGRVVISGLALIFSLGLWRMADDYRRFADGAAQIDSRAEGVKKAPQVDPVEAARLLRDYQAIRNGAPMIPTFVYRYRREELNALWESEGKG